MDKSLVARAALGDHIFTEFMTAKIKSGIPIEQMFLNGN